MLTKSEIVGNYRKDKERIEAVWKIETTDGSISEKRKILKENQLSLALFYLKEYPELHDKNCAGRGLPAMDAKTIKDYLTWF